MGLTAPGNDGLMLHSELLNVAQAAPVINLGQLSAHRRCIFWWVAYYSAGFLGFTRVLLFVTDWPVGRHAAAEAICRLAFAFPPLRPHVPV
jgi:hypothetical protein